MKRNSTARRTLPATAKPKVEGHGFVPPYGRSWLNRLADWVDRLPGPAWWPYVLLGLILLTAQIAVQWAGGTYPVGRVDLFNMVVAFTVPYQLGLMHYLLRTAAHSLEEFRPALRADPAQAAELKFRLTTLPARGTFWAGLGVTAGALLIVLLSSLASSLGLPWLTKIVGDNILLTFAQVFRISTSPASLGLSGLITLASWWTTGAYAYLAIHQLRLIDRIFTRFAYLRLFRLGPLYAFSRHTLRSSIGLLILAYALIATAPSVVYSPVGGASWLLLVTGGVAIFLLPLLGIHRQLVREKDRMLEEAGRRMEAGVAELHRRMDKNELARMDDLNKALSSLEIERAALEHVPTWPWERGTLRSLVAAIVIPLLVWAIQAILQRYLAG